MGNFIDKTFTVIADILLKVLPASKQEKQAFSYYRAGMAAQSRGRYEWTPVPPCLGMAATTGSRIPGPRTENWKN